MSYSFLIILRLVIIFEPIQVDELLLSAQFSTHLEIKELIFVEFVILTDG
jgi:hypothetical protein